MDFSPDLNGTEDGHFAATSAAVSAAPQTAAATTAPYTATATSVTPVTDVMRRELE